MKHRERFRILCMLYCPTLFEWWRWRGWSPNKDNPSVFYGYDQLPTRDQFVGGGIIKCQDLSVIFPNSPDFGSILYLVSSALPFSATPMVRNARKKGLKVVLNQNGVAYPGWAKGEWKRINIPLKGVIQEADFVIYQSQFCKISADRYLGEVSAPHSILYNSVDTSFFTPAQIYPEGFRLLLAGSHNQFYRIRAAFETLLKIRHYIGEAKLIIAGRYLWRESETQSLQEAMAYAVERDIDKYVEFTGPYTQKNAPALIQGCHMLLHTQYNDSCPRLVIEAMSCGLPIVYSASGGTPELVGDKAGIGIPAPLDWEKEHPPEASELADAVLKIWQNYTDYASAARNRAVEEFDTSLWLRRHQEIFNRLCH
jgi:glycosyltransferase involved in cell wall biosynthesis